MRRLARGQAGPQPQVLARAGLRRGERVLASARSDAGQWLLGTRDRFLAVAPDGGDAGHAADAAAEAAVESADAAGDAAGDAADVPWERVQRVDWDGESSRLRVVEAGEYGEPLPTHVFVVDEPGDLLPLVRERVTASVVLQRRAQVDIGRGLTVTARRPPRGGDVSWSYELDEGLDPRDPEVAATAERGLRAAQEELGL